MSDVADQNVVEQKSGSRIGLFLVLVLLAGVFAYGALQYYMAQQVKSFIINTGNPESLKVQTSFGLNGFYVSGSMSEHDGLLKFSVKPSFFFDQLFVKGTLEGKNMIPFATMEDPVDVELKLAIMDEKIAFWQRPSHLVGVLDELIEAGDDADIFQYLKLSSASITVPKVSDDAGSKFDQLNINLNKKTFEVIVSGLEIVDSQEKLIFSAGQLGFGLGLGIDYDQIISSSHVLINEDYEAYFKRLLSDVKISVFQEGIKLYHENKVAMDYKKDHTELTIKVMPEGKHEITIGLNSRGEMEYKKPIIDFVKSLPHSYFYMLVDEKMVESLLPVMDDLIQIGPMKGDVKASLTLQGIDKLSEEVLSSPEYWYENCIEKQACGLSFDLVSDVELHRLGIKDAGSVNFTVNADGLSLKSSENASPLTKDGDMQGMEKLANYRNSVGVLIGASNFSAVNNALSHEIHLDIKVKDWLKKVVERDICIDHDPLGCFVTGDEIDMLFKVVLPGEKKGVNDTLKLVIPKLQLSELKKMVSENQSIRILMLESMGQLKLDAMLIENYQSLTAGNKEQFFDFIAGFVDNPIAYDQGKVDQLIIKLIKMMTVKDPQLVTLDFYGQDFWLGGERISEYHALITSALQAKVQETIVPKREAGEEVWPVFPVEHLTR